MTRREKKCVTADFKLLDDADRGGQGRSRRLTDVNDLCSGEYGCGHAIEAHKNPTTKRQAVRHLLPLKSADGRSVEEQLREYGLPVRSRELRLTCPQPIGGATTQFPENTNSLNGTDRPCRTVFKTWCDTFCHQSYRNKHHTPGPYLPASPGMGKTRLLQVLATPASDSDNDINGRAKRDALTAFEGKDDFWPSRKERARFCTAFRQAVGVYCTFNKGQGVQSSHPPDSSNVESALAARLYYAYWIDMKHIDFAAFCSRFVWGQTTTGPVVRAIRADINDEDRPLVICVDEIMLWGDACGSEKHKRVSNLIQAVTELPTSHRQLYTVFSSLDTEAVHRGRTWSHRALVPAMLEGLDEQYARELILGMLPKSQELPDFLDVLIRDCNGCPRLLEHVSMILCQRDDANSQLESLAAVASKLANHSIYKTQPCLTTSTVQTRLFRALVLAMRATTVGEKTLGHLSQHGLISQALEREYRDRVHVAPLFAMIVHQRWCQVENEARASSEETSPIAKVISQLLDWFSKYLTYDEKLHNPFIATSVEVQFALAWAMKCCALVSSTDKGEFDESVSKTLTLAQLLNSTRNVLSASIVVPATPATKDTDPLPFRDMNASEFSGSVVIPTGVMIRLTNPNNEGYDLLAVYNTPEDEQFAIVVEVKYSAPESSTTLSNSLVVESVRKTVTHHPYLHRFINSGRFLFVFAAYRPATDYVSVDGCLKEALEKGNSDCEETDSLVNTVVDKHLHLMLQRDIEWFLGPTLNARPQFWSREPTAHPLKKRKTK